MAQGKAGHKVVQTSVKPAEVVVNKDRIEHPFKGSMDGQRVDGYRGIWFTIGQARSDYGDKYSGGLGTYTMKHIPMAVYSKEEDVLCLWWRSGRPRELPPLHDWLL